MPGGWVIGIEGIGVHEYMEYMRSVLKGRDAAVESLLARRLAEARSSKPRVERGLRSRGDVFRVKAYLLGQDVRVRSPAGIQIPLRIASNPAILIEGGDAVLYVRVSTLGSHPIPDPGSRTFICVGRVRLGELEGRLRLDATPALYPITYVERVEDPRVFVGARGTELYHVRAVMPLKPLAGADSFVITFASTLEGEALRPNRMEPVRFRSPDGGEGVIRDYRDTFPLSESVMVVRPWFEDLGLGAPLTAPREGPVVDAAAARAYPELMPTSVERKTGSNCAVRVSSNEYLLIFHGVDSVFGTYHTYAALLSGDGELLAVTPEPILSPRPHDYFGARPSTLFPCGAALLGDELVVSAGKDDEVVLILSAPLSKVFERMEFLAP